MIVMSILNFFFFFFFTFSAFSPKFGKLFDEVSFRQGVFSAKWLFGEVVFGKVSCIDICDDQTLQARKRCFESEKVLVNNKKVFIGRLSCIIADICILSAH